MTISSYSTSRPACRRPMLLAEKTACLSDWWSIWARVPSLGLLAALISRFQAWSCLPEHGRQPPALQPSFGTGPSRRRIWQLLSDGFLPLSANGFPGRTGSPGMIATNGRCFGGSEQEWGPRMKLSSPHLDFFRRSAVPGWSAGWERCRLSNSGLSPAGSTNCGPSLPDTVARLWETGSTGLGCR